MRRPIRSTDPGLIVRGSLITLRRRCGKSACRCAQDEPHATPALSYSVGGSTKMLTLQVEDIPEVQAALARYRKALADLDRRALHGLAAFRARIAHRKASRHGRG